MIVPFFYIIHSIMHCWGLAGWPVSFQKASWCAALEFFLFFFPVILSIIIAWSIGLLSMRQILHNEKFIWNELALEERQAIHFLLTSPR